MSSRAPLRFEHAGERVGIERARAEPIHGLGRKRDELPALESRDRDRDELRRGAFGIDRENADGAHVVCFSISRSFRSTARTAMLAPMSKPSRRSLPLLALGSLVCVPFVVAASVAACGGGNPPKTADNTASGSATSSGSTAPETTTSTPTGEASGSTSSAPPQASTYTSKKATQKRDPAWAKCHESYKPASGGKDLAGDVTKMASLCKDATHMHLIGSPQKGTASEEGGPVKFPFKAKAGKCYRAFAESSSGIKDLDMQIKDSANEMAGDDSTDDPSPIVMEDGAVCFTVDDDAVVSVAVGSGKGSFALQIWGDE
jgi:hypothetical protein